MNKDFKISDSNHSAMGSNSNLFFKITEEDMKNSNMYKSIKGIGKYDL